MSEDRQCLENALSLVRLSKAFDMLANTSRAYSRAGRAFKVVETWVKTRESDLYQVFLAPFYYKLADMLTAHIEINSDELGNIKPLDCDSDESEQEDEQVEEVKQEERPEDVEQAVAIEPEE
jgi:hypothetical protein